jgi:Na+-transporting NADH:ubiquinone oxidoreductase subunit E
MLEHVELFFKSIFIDNMVFATFLGMCSYLAVSKKVSTAVGLGAAVIFVMAVTVPLNWLLDYYLLRSGALVWLGPEYADYDLVYRYYCYHGSIGRDCRGKILSFAV